MDTTPDITANAQQTDLVNRRFDRMAVSMRQLGPDMLDACLDLQEKVKAGIEDNGEPNIYEPLARDEMRYSLEHDICIGFFNSGDLIGQLNLILEPTEPKDLLPDVRDLVPARITSAGVIDCTYVAQRCRGFGLQRRMIDISVSLAKRHGLQALLATVSPNNVHSARNFILGGFHAVGTRPKYHAQRDFYLREIG